MARTHARTIRPRHPPNVKGVDSLRGDEVPKDDELPVEYVGTEYSAKLL